MTERGEPSGEILPDHGPDEYDVHAGSIVSRPEQAQGDPGGLLSQQSAIAVPEYAGTADALLTYESGVEPKARSQWAYARIRFFRHRMAVVSLVVLFLICLVGIFAKRVAPYAYDELDLFNITSPPTLKDKHLFGTDLLGRDYLSRVIFG